MKNNKNFIQKRMLLEKKWITYISIVIGILILLWTFFTLAMIRLIAKDWSQTILELDKIDTKEKIDKFYNSKYYSSILHFESAIDTGEVIYIETTTEKETAILGSTGGIVLDGPEKTEIEEYNVYILTCKGTTVVLCSNYKDMDFSRGQVVVYNEYTESYVNEELIDKYDDTGEGYVFYSGTNFKPKVDNRSDGPIIIVRGYIILLFPLVIIRNLKFIYKRTKLGKKVSEFGKFDIIVQEINTQIDHAIYTYGNAIVTYKYVLILKQVETEIIKIEEITDIEVLPDEKYPEEIIKIELKSNNEVYNFNVYNKEDAEKIKQYIIINKAGN